MARFLFCFFGLLGFGGWLGTAFAQAPATSATFDPPTARVGRPVEYRVTIASDQRVSDLPNLLPPLGLELQPAGSTQRLTSINGEIIALNTLSFTAIPSRAGEFTVPSFDVLVDGQRVRVPAAKLTVNPPGPDDVPYQPLRVILDLPDREFFVGESVDGRLLFLSTPDEMPQFVQHIAKTTGSVLLKPGRQARNLQLQWQGKPASGMAMPVEVTPIVEGVSVVTCEAIVQIIKLDPAGRRAGFGVQSTVQSTPLRLRVLPLPVLGKPPGFTGAIGEFEIGAPKLSAGEGQTGEPITLSFSLTGRGNLESVPAPELADQPNWTIYKPASELARDEDTLRLTKTFTYTFVPKKAGRHGTPPLPFAYFDPVKRTYVDLTIPPIPFVATAAPRGPEEAPAAAASTATPAPADPEPTLSGLAEKPGLWTASIGPSFRVFFYAQVIPPFLLLALWGWRRRREYLEAHPGILLRRRARAAARRALGEARSAARRGDASAFVRAGAGALCEAAAQLDTARAASLTPAEVLGALDGEAAHAARQIFDYADAHRYAAGADALPKPGTLLPGLEKAVATLNARA